MMQTLGRWSVLILGVLLAGCLGATDAEAPASEASADTATVEQATTSPFECTGELLCCQTITTTSDAAVRQVLSLLGVQAPNTTAGLGCQPMSADGGGGSCTQQPACCQSNLSGLVALDCEPMNL